MKGRSKLGPIFTHGFLIIMCVVSVFPLLWLLMSAFKSSAEMLANGKAARAVIATADAATRSLNENRRVRVSEITGA